MHNLIRFKARVQVNLAINELLATHVCNLSGRSSSTISARLLHPRKPKSVALLITVHKGSHLLSGFLVASPSPPEDQSLVRALDLPFLGRRPTAAA